MHWRCLPPQRQVVVHETHLRGRIVTYQGSVNASGDVSAFYETTVNPRVGFASVSGTIHGKEFTGQRLITVVFVIIASKCGGPPHVRRTMLPNGEYSGVTQEVARALSLKT